MHFKKIFNPLKRVSNSVRRSLVKRDLADLLKEANPVAPLAVKVLWLEQIFSWIRSSTDFSHEFDETTGGIHNVRIRFILHLLEKNPEWKRAFIQTVRAILRQTSMLELLCRTGLVAQSGFFSEIRHRMVGRFIPAPPKEQDFSEVFLRLFPKQADSVWFESLAPATVASVLTLLHCESPEGELKPHLDQAVLDAGAILGALVLSLSLDPEMRERLPKARIIKSPFFQLDQSLSALAAESERGKKEANFSLEALLSQCRSEIQTIFATLEESGVSVPLVYNLERELSMLKRIEILVLLQHSESGGEGHLQRFIADLIRENHENRTLVDFFHRHLHLLSRKIAERAGDSGEHYITTNRKEYFQMLRSAVGGGLLTVVTATLKLVISTMRLPLFFEGLFTSLNYVASFVTMQFCHFTLATKQPSMTASALAGKLVRLEDPSKVEAFTEQVSRINRSQFIAFLGNVGAVIPGAICLDLLSRLLFGKPVLRVELAHYVIHSLHPFKSLTIPAAAVTGVVLWSASVIAGGMENWAVYHRLSDAIAENRHLKFILGETKAKRLSHWFFAQVGGLGGNISLGFLLAFTPVFGRFFGLPLDIRHVTLSTGALALASCALFQNGLEIVPVLWAVLGILFIGLLNFGVSFALALIVAAEARQVPREVLFHLLRRVWVRFKMSTNEFFWPPRT